MVRSLRFLSVLCMLVGLAWLGAGLAEAQDANPSKVKSKPPMQPPAANQAPSDDASGSAQQVVQEAEPAPKIAAPQPFTTKDGKRRGWKVKIPGDHALATPAVVDGKLFIGGGFGSHEFYAFDPQTGKMLWQYRTSDDGPTAAVVAEGYVAFNTESCELELLDATISPPALANGKVFVGTGYGDVACLSTDQGELLWKVSLGQSESIGFQPAVAGGRVFVSTESGSLFSLETGDSKDDGWLIWGANAAHNGIVQADRHAR